MCARATLISSAADVARWLGLDITEWEPRYNLSPGQDLVAVRLGAGGEPEAVPMRWGLVPNWAADPRIAYHTVNARAETVATKPSFRDAFRTRRCLVIVDGWYEWATVPGQRRKQPYAIRMPDGSPFALAGIWDSWRAPLRSAREEQGELGTERSGVGATTEAPVTTCAVITTPAADATVSIHDRMPAVLPAERFPAWLDPRTPVSEAAHMLQPYRGPLSIHPVSTIVNNGRVDDARCLVPTTPPKPELDLFSAAG
jgi:putative SOS response-associated peptidase YedK